jgi:hypothetical protein
MTRNDLEYLPDIICPICGTEMTVQNSHPMDIYSDEQIDRELECFCEKCAKYRTLYCVYKPAYYYFVRDSVKE